MKYYSYKGYRFTYCESLKRMVAALELIDAEPTTKDNPGYDPYNHVGKYI